MNRTLVLPAMPSAVVIPEAKGVDTNENTGVGIFRFLPGKFRLGAISLGRGSPRHSRHARVRPHGLVQFAENPADEQSAPQTQVKNGIFH